MNVALPPALLQFVQNLVSSGRYSNEDGVMSDALRVLERQEMDSSPALEAALLEGVRSPHHPYDASVLERVRTSARGA